MYYKSRRNRLMNWLGNTNLKPYVWILISLLIVIAVILLISRQPLADYFSEDQASENSIAENAVTNSPDLSSIHETDKGETESLAEKSLYIIVNKYDNMVSIWNTIDGRIDSIACLFNASINSELENGIYSINEKNTWRTLEDYTCVQYSSKGLSCMLFHSPVYEFQNPGYMIVASYHAIGASNDNIPGITLTVSDAKWIYENCPNETIVEICENDSMDYGVTAEELRQIPDGIRWDPTDPDKDNKWVSTEIKFLQGVTDKTVSAGTAVDPWDGVYACSVDGSNITNKLTIINNVDINTPGTYTIEYILADFTGQVIRQYSNITVTE